MKSTMSMTALWVAIVMALALQTGVLAQESQTQVPNQTSMEQSGTAVTEEPSPWALEGAQWSSIYELVKPDMLANYKSGVKRAELYGTACNLYMRVTGKNITPVEVSPYDDADDPAVRAACAIGILTGQGSIEPEKAVTRNEMAHVIYNALLAADVGLELEKPSDSTIDTTAVEYFVSNSLLKGKGGDSMYLEDSCSRQELMVFVHRVYEFVAYETGNYSKGLFWKASDEDSSVYLLGSIHIAGPSLYPLSKDILSAFESSDTLVLEADLSKLSEDIAYMQEKMVYTGDDTLDKNIPKELYDKYIETVTSLGIPAEMCNKFKPWYAAMLLQNLALVGNQESSYSADLGIDMYFTSKAVNGKDIDEIEGLRFQVDMFDSLSNEIQVWYLASSLTTSPDAGQAAQQASATNATFDFMLSAWEKGDANTIEAMVKSTDSSTPEAVEFNTIFWNTRNNHMYEKTKEYLADPEKKVYFIVVGAGHMEGETGIVTQLTNNGYEVQRILN